MPASPRTTLAAAAVDDGRALQRAHVRRGRGKSGEHGIPPDEAVTAAGHDVLQPEGARRVLDMLGTRAAFRGAHPDLVDPS